MLKLVSLNIERSRHLHLNIPFFRAEQPDVLCLQEVLEADIETISRELEMAHHIWIKDILTDAPSNSDGRTGYSGPAIFSRLPLSQPESEYYYLPPNGISLEGESEQYPETNAQAIVWASVGKDGTRYTIASTHFTWSKDGQMTPKQTADFEALKRILDRLPPHILTGDLNAPRGRGMWEKFVAYYGHDYIPLDTLSTLDPNLHRVKNLNLVVDAIFSKPPFTVTSIQIKDGVSDHKAIIATITPK